MNREEQRTHIAIVAYLRAVLPEPCMVWHPANGGLRTRREAALFKALGVLAGVPDLVVMAPGRQCLFLEVKASTGRESPEQKAFSENARAMGFTCATVRSIDDVRKTLRALSIHTREARHEQRPTAAA
jgi:hypothetical protein